MDVRNLIKKYNVPVPRYTSYPPANYFTEEFTNRQYEEALINSNQETPRHISFYIHIPFCRQLCHYCGCNSIAMMKQNVVDEYIRCLYLEIDKVVSYLDKSRKISQIHFGGGTPTVLPIAVLKELIDHLLSSFDTIDDPEIAIECHPGFADETCWLQLAQAGFNRFSLGVQDLNEQVLKVVNRKSSIVPLNTIFDILRDKGGQINLDLLYGLPLQTAESFAHTVETAVTLSPDRLVTFSYGHVPWVNSRQKILEKTGFPTGEEKSKMFEVAQTILTSRGYQAIGMDHFVKEEDELFRALQDKTLHRNFQGYCTRRTTGQVYAFGVTGISQLASSYIQNQKDILSYMEQIKSGTLAVTKGYALSREEQITRCVIQELMCNLPVGLIRCGFCIWIFTGRNKECDSLE